MAAQQAPPSLEFSRQEHWSGLPFPSPMHESEKWKWSRSVVSHPQWSHGLQPSRLLHAWDFLGKSTGVGCHCLLQNVMIEHLKLINIYRTVYLKVANKQNMHYFQAHREHSLRYCTSVQFSSVQLLSHVQLFVTPWTAACQASMSITNSRSLLNHRVSDAIQPSHPLSALSPVAFNLSQRVSSLHQVAKVLQLQFQHQSFQWIFRVDFL